MTIARDFTARPDLDEHGAGSVSEVAPVPVALRAERLAVQIASFERAGYRLETTAGFHAVMVRQSPRRRFRSALIVVATAGLYLMPLLLGAGRTHHRVVISVDGSGAVRMA